MIRNWQEAFTKKEGFVWEDPYKKPYSLLKPSAIDSFQGVKEFLDIVHIKFCLLRPFFEHEDYPLVSAQELLPSFEPTMDEYSFLPAFGLLVLNRSISYFDEIFQFDILHCIEDVLNQREGPASPLIPSIFEKNKSTFLSRLPRNLHEDFIKFFEKKNLVNMQNYPSLLNFILHMDRGHVIARNSLGRFYLCGIYASFPSNLDSELKIFGVRIGKFKPGDNVLYELNRNFVYQFLMELYGFPIASERRTSAALFSRTLFKMGEEFIIKVLGQSDRTITSLYTTEYTKKYPQVEKIALVDVSKHQKEKLNFLREKGFLLEKDDKLAVIIRVLYKQHRYDPNNIRTDRALSVSLQEIIHPLTGEVISNINILKDTVLMTLILNDIVKGEFQGKVRYKKFEVVENTEKHEDRLKVLYSWLKKHQRRIIGYSEEFFLNVKKVLDNYLLDSDNYEIFKEHYDLYQEVLEQYRYIQQARKIKELEDIAQKKYEDKKLNYLNMLERAVKIMEELKFEMAHYFDSIVEKAEALCERILNDKYLINRYVKPDDDKLSSYGLRIKKLYGQLVKILDEIKEIKKSKRASNVLYRDYLTV